MKMGNRTLPSLFALVVSALFVTACRVPGAELAVPPEETIGILEQTPADATPAVPGVEPTPATLQGEPRAPDASAARDAAVSQTIDIHGVDAPAPGITWKEERTTTEGLVGVSTTEYRAGDWLVTVSFPIVAPESTVYQVSVENELRGLLWEGKVDAEGRVTETTALRVEAEPTPPPGPIDLDVLVDGNTRFAMDLYRVLGEEHGNLFFSPYSISSALAMTYAGARGGTAEEMAQTLHLPPKQEQVHRAFRDLAAELASRGEGAAGKDGKGFRLNIVNALWGQQGYQFLPRFLDLLAESYGAGLRELDFMDNPEAARVTINDWVEERTEGRIQDLIPPGALHGLTRLVLTNAIYFNAAWAEPFDAGRTADGVFHTLSGDDVQVLMMSNTTTYGYAAADGYEAIELPYDGWETSMVLLLPDSGGFEDLEDSLDAAKLASILADLEHRQVALTMPKFEFDGEFSMNRALSRLGMATAFTTAADFSGMTGDRDLFVDEVLHKAFVGVDEAGTEAAAATAVMMRMASIPQDLLEVTIDRPFIFLIRDNETGSILFVGRVVNPVE